MVADGRTDQVGTIAEVAVAHQQIDASQVHVPEVERDLLGFRTFVPFHVVVGHRQLQTIHVDGLER